MRSRIAAGTALVAWSIFAPTLAFAADVLTLTWADLVPVGEAQSPLAGAPSLTDYSFTRRVIVPTKNGKAEQPPSTGVRPDLIGKRIRIAGFFSRFASDDAGSAGAVLVPYLGACAHIRSCLPAPRANQMIDLGDAKIAAAYGPEAPVWVTGTLQAKTRDTALGTIDYRIGDAVIEPYEE